MRPSRLNWMKQQEDLLKYLRQTQKIQSWKLIAEQINRKFQDKNRCSKQCRQRYINYVKFDCNKPKITNWTPQQNSQFFKMFMQLGPRWGLIASSMVGRSQNCVKNHFYGAMRKVVRKLDKVARQHRLKNKKILKVQTLIKVLEFSSRFKKHNIDKQATGLQISDFLSFFSNQIVELALNFNRQLSVEETERLINNLCQFCINIKGSKRGKFPKKQNFEIQQNSIEKSQDNTSGKTQKLSCIPSIEGDMQNSDAAKAENSINQQLQAESENNFLNLESILQINNTHDVLLDSFNNALNYGNDQKLEQDFFFF